MLEWNAPDDREILELIRKGDRHALVKLYRANQPSVRKYLLQNNGTADDVDDLLQEAVVVVWQNASKPDFQLTSKLSTYVMAICKNLWLKQLNRQKRYEDESHIDPSAHSDFTDTRKMDMKRVVAMVNRLGDSCRELLSLFYFEGLDMETIAQKLNYANAQTAKAKKYQCFKKLEEMFRSKYSREDFMD